MYVEPNLEQAVDRSVRRDNGAVPYFGKIRICLWFHFYDR